MKKNENNEVEQAFIAYADKHGIGTPSTMFEAGAEWAKSQLVHSVESREIEAHELRHQLKGHDIGVSRVLGVLSEDPQYWAHLLAADSEVALKDMKNRVRLILELNDMDEP